MTTQVPTSVIDLLLEDHALAKRAFESFDGLQRDKWQPQFAALIHILIAHEIAEEAVVYPALRALPGGAEIADARIKEQDEAERVLKDMEHLDPMSLDFEVDLKELRAAVLEHAGAEEAEAFPLLASHKSPEALAELGAVYTSAKAHAPTHAHPHAPSSPPFSVIAVPVAAAFDKIRDAIAKRLV